MTKIKITKEEKELEGKIEEGDVKPFGNSAHIPFSKKHTGKKVNVIVPSHPHYIWLLTPSEKQKIIRITKKIIIKEDGKLEHYRLNLLDEISKEKFNIEALIKIVYILEKNNKEKQLIKKIKKLYNLN